MTAPPVQPAQSAASVKSRAPRGPGHGGLVNPVWTDTTSPINWKGLLQDHLSKEIGRSFVKGDMDYQTTCEETGAGRVYWGSVVCNCLADAGGALQYTSEEPAKTEKEAHQLVAKFVMWSLRPDIHDEAERLHLEFLVQNSDAGPFSAAAGDSAAKRRKTDSAAKPAADAKSQLNTAAQILLGRPITKADLVFDTSVVEGTSPEEWISSVQLPAFDADTWIQ